LRKDQKIKGGEEGEKKTGNSNWQKKKEKKLHTQTLKSQRRGRGSASKRTNGREKRGNVKRHTAARGLLGKSGIIGKAKVLGQS